VAVALPGRRGRRNARVFSHSHLGFGNKQLMGALSAAEIAACLPSGACATKAWELPEGGLGPAPPGGFCGTGSPVTCDAAIGRVLGAFDHTVGQVQGPARSKRRRALRVVFVSLPRRGGVPVALCPSTPSSGFSAPPQPAIAGRRFVGMSLLFYAVHFATLAGYLPLRTPPRYSPSELGAAAHRLCAEPHAQLYARLQGRDPLTDGAMAWRCFDLLYTARLLVDGYGLDAQSAAVDFYGEIDGTEVEWTLGALHAHLADAHLADGAAGGKGDDSDDDSAAQGGGWTAWLLGAAAASLLLLLAGVALLCWARRRLARGGAGAYTGVERHV